MIHLISSIVGDTEKSSEQNVSHWNGMLNNSEHGITIVPLPLQKCSPEQLFFM